MSQSRLSRIRGLKISDAILTVGEAGFSFENGGSLSIYNNFAVTGAASQAESLIGKAVAEVTEEQHMIRLTLDGGVVITIDMRDEAYNGPEALQLRIPGEPIVVWN